MAAVAKNPTTTPTTTLVPTPTQVVLFVIKTMTNITEVAAVIAQLMANKFAMISTQSTELQAQLTIYFYKVVIMNEQILSFCYILAISCLCGNRFMKTFPWSLTRLFFSSIS